MSNISSLVAVCLLYPQHHFNVNQYFENRDKRYDDRSLSLLGIVNLMVVSVVSITNKIKIFIFCEVMTQQHYLNNNNITIIIRNHLKIYTRLIIFV